MPRGSRACKVVNLVNFELEPLGYVMPDELEVLPPNQVRDIELLAGEQVVEADDLMAPPKQPFA